MHRPSEHLPHPSRRPRRVLPAGAAWAARWLALCLAVLSPAIAPAASARAQGLPPDVRFGAVEAFRDPVAAAEVGVSWERILFYWSELQPGGPDDWNPYHVPDEWLTLAAQANRQVVGVLKNTPPWATDGPPGCGVPRGLDLPVDDPNNLWAVFVRRVVGRYAGRVDHWIIWNEPDIAPGTYGVEWCGTIEQYYQLLKVAYIAAHQANPNVTIHLACLTYHHDRTYLRRFLAVAARDPSAAANGYYFDVASLHIYFCTETVPAIIGITRQALADYGLRKPIWLNETNAPPNSDPQWVMPAANYQISLEQQAAFLLQSFALALSAGAEIPLVLYDPDAVNRNSRARQLIDALGDVAVPVTERVLRSVADTQNPQGIVGMVRVPEPAEATPSGRLVLVLDAVQDPGNVGTILRAAVASGVNAVIVGPDCADVYSPKVVRAGMGAHFHVDLFTDLDWPQIERLTAGRQRLVGAPVGGRVYSQVYCTRPSALVISNEGAGPSLGALRLAGGQGNGKVSIPIVGAADSLNAAVAAGILLFEAARQASERRGQQQDRGPRQDRGQRRW